MNRRLAAALITAVSLVLVATTAVAADDLLADGDGLAPAGPNVLDFGTVCAGAGRTMPVAIAVKASNHPTDTANIFVGGSTLPLEVGTISTLAGGTASATGGSISLPSDWQTVANGTQSPAAISNVTLAATAANSAWRGSIAYRVTGPRVAGGTLTKGTSLNAKATIVVCADTTPPNLTLPGDMTVEAAGPDGAVVAYEATATDPPSGGLVPPSCTPASGSTFPLGATQVECTATDAAGNVASGTFTVTVIDTTAPAVSITLAPGGASWADTPVVVSVSATDLVGIDTTEISVDGAAMTAYVAPLTVDADGSHVIQARAVDAAGNVGGASAAVAIDTTPPVVTVTGVADGATYQLGSVPSAGCSTQDAGSGVATEATLAMSGDPAAAAGPYTATCSGAADVAGNVAAAVEASFTVAAPEPEPEPGPEMADGGKVLAPIASGRTKVVTRGRVVPFRFRLLGDGPGGYPTAAWDILRVRIDCRHPNVELWTSRAPSANKRGLWFHADRYRFQADFRKVRAGTCWRMRVVFEDDSSLTSGPFRIAGPKAKKDKAVEATRVDAETTKGDRPDRPERPQPGKAG